jgi:uncharacterized protein
MQVDGRIVRVDALKAALQPWRNGGGSTRQLFTWPPGEDWIFRISLANVDRSGPFSSFPGIDRHIAIVEGSAVSLVFEGGGRIVTLNQAPFHFDGALAPMCLVEAGPATDLNLMVDRLRGVGFLSCADAEPWTNACEWQGVFSADLCQISIGAMGRVDLEPMTLLMTRGMGGVTWKFDGADSKSRAWWIAVSPAGSTKRPSERM